MKIKHRGIPYSRSSLPLTRFIFMVCVILLKKLLPKPNENGAMLSLIHLRDKMTHFLILNNFICFTGLIICRVLPFQHSLYKPDFGVYFPFPSSLYFFFYFVISWYTFLQCAVHCRSVIFGQPRWSKRASILPQQMETNNKKGERYGNRQLANRSSTDDVLKLMASFQSAETSWRSHNPNIGKSTYS